MIIAELELTEMPKNCEESPLFIYSAYDYGACAVTDIGYDKEDARTDRSIGTDCPLREVPDGLEKRK